MPNFIALLSGEITHSASAISPAFTASACAMADFGGSSKEKQLFSGHMTENQVVTYDRRVKISPGMDIPMMKKMTDIIGCTGKYTQ